VKATFATAPDRTGVISSLRSSEMMVHCDILPSSQGRLAQSEASTLATSTHKRRQGNMSIGSPGDVEINLPLRQRCR
jgi:hypothetical protein